MVGHLCGGGWVTYVLEVGHFWVKKKSSKHINMGSSFEDLVAISPTVKTDPKSDKRFDLQNFLNFRFLHLMRMMSAILSFCV